VYEAIPAVNFGKVADFSLGVEDELLLVDPVSLQLKHEAAAVLTRLSHINLHGAADPDCYAGLIELATPICSDATQAAAAVARLRRCVRMVGATTIGAGLHPTADFGDVVRAPGARYRLLAHEMRGLLARTPTCALHIHVAMPDADTAIRACNALRTHLPLLQALSANSPFWFGRNSGLASARAQVFREFPTAEMPPAYSSFDEYAEAVSAVATAAEVPDYTFLWWDVRPHPVLGTVEVRAMDSQSSVRTIAGLTALVQALARWAAEQHGPWPDRQVLMESSFRAARDGLDATWWDGTALRPAAEIARATLDLARPYAAELGSEGALEEVERLLIEGNGARRQRDAFVRGGLRAVLAGLAEETAQLDRALAVA
jgi:carboxylate-amine ligase